MRKIEENYQRIKDDRRLFDIRFWQSQGNLAIFEAVAEMLNDYFLIRGKNKTFHSVPTKKGLKADVSQPNASSICWIIFSLSSGRLP